jgi:hypothetical protein
MSSEYEYYFMSTSMGTSMSSFGQNSVLEALPAKTLAKLPFV